MNRNIKFKVFQEDDLVLLYNSKLGPHAGKLKLRYVGPFKIIKVIGQGTFLLSDLAGNVFPKPVNGFRLKKFYGQIQGQDIQVGSIEPVGDLQSLSIKSTHFNDVQNILLLELCNLLRDYSRGCERYSFPRVRFLIAAMTEDRRKLSEDRGEGLSEADKQVVSAFIDLTQAKMKLRKSPRLLKEIVAKQETSSFSLEDEEDESEEEVETQPQ